MIKYALNYKVENERLLLFATLSRHFNSYFEISRSYLDFITNQVSAFLFTSPFVDFYKRSAQDKCNIGVWTVDETLFLNLKSRVSYVETFGEQPAKIYIPLDFQESFRSLFDLLGSPDHVLEGLLVSSGRSVWVFDKEGPFCIKYDTSQLLEKKYFTEAHLNEPGIWHSKAVTEMLRKEDNMFFEEAGLSIVLEEVYENEEKRKLTYLIRKLNPNFNFASDDNLIPLHCFLSPRFWQNDELLNSLGINRPFTDFVPELAEVFADFITNGIARTAIHFESHQQNISLQVGAGKIKKIIVQDLQDIFFDPIAYFGIAHPIEAADFQVVRDKLFNFQWLLHFNAQGELIKHDALLREALTVSSFYRRYVSNQAHVNESVAVLSGQDNFLSHDFETQVLNHLNMSLPLQSTGGVVDADVLKNDLFWYIDRYVYEQHQKIADEYYSIAIERKAAQVGVDELMSHIKNFNVIVSANFPIHISKIREEMFETIYDLFDKSVFLARYDGKAVMIMIFRYVSI